MLRRMGEDLVAEKKETQRLHQRLIDHNIILSLQRMISIRRTEKMERMLALLREQVGVALLSMLAWCTLSDPE